MLYAMLCYAMLYALCYALCSMLYAILYAIFYAMLYGLCSMLYAMLYAMLYGMVRTAMLWYGTHCYAMLCDAMLRYAMRSATGSVCLWHGPLVSWVPLRLILFLRYLDSEISRDISRYPRY